jgi:hypothetical protein
MAVTPTLPTRRAAVVWSGVVAVLTIATAARLEMVAALADQGRFDKYLFFARQIVGGELPVARLGDLSPGYLWTVTALHAAGVGPYGIRALQVIAVSVAALLCAAAAKRRWGNVAALVAGVAVLGSRGALVNATEFEPETLILLLHAVAVWLLVRHTGPAGGGVAGLVLGLSAATRPTVLAPALAIALWLGWCAVSASRSDRSAARRAWRTVVLFALGLALPVGVVRLVYAGFPGGATPMNPGTVLYEGLNPSATGYAGEAPRIVKDVEFTLNQPDALHIAYRLVAARALEEGLRADEANRFWFDRALAFGRFEPAAAARLVASKLVFAAMSYEAWDLKSMAMRDLELRGRLWLPFGLTLMFAVLGLVLGSPKRVLVPVGLLAIGPVVVMVIFYVTSRQRNALIPALAVLAAAGVQVVLDRWRGGRRRDAVVLALVAAGAGVALSIDGPVQREDRWRWMTAAARDDALANAVEARAENDDARDIAWQVEAAIRGATIPDDTVAYRVRDEVRRRLGNVTRDSERFDLAAAALRCGDLETAEGVLRTLVVTGFQPHRGIECPRTAAFQLAIIALRRGDVAAARRWLVTARQQAPGEAGVLALTVVTMPSDDPDALRAGRELDALHDPFSAAFARAQAFAEMGDSEAARKLVLDTTAAIPEWTRPRDWMVGTSR